MARIIAVANQKGGVGKTTTVINLACGLSLAQKRVLVVDFDPQGQATSGFGLEKQNLRSTIYSALLEKPEIQHLIHPTPSKNVMIIPANVDLAGAEIELVEVDRREERLRDVIGSVGGEFDYCLIDCPPSLGILTVNALVAAHSVLIPVQCEYYALEGLSRLMDSLSLIQGGLNPSLKIEGVVLTMEDGRTNLSQQVVDEVRGYFRENVFKTVIPRNVRLAEAPSFGQSIIDYDIRSTGAEAYLKLTKEMLNRHRENRGD